MLIYLDRASLQMRRNSDEEFPVFFLVFVKVICRCSVYIYMCMYSNSSDEENHLMRLLEMILDTHIETLQKKQTFITRHIILDYTGILQECCKMPK